MQKIVSKAQYLTLAFRKLLIEMCLPVVPHWDETAQPYRLCCLLNSEQRGCSLIKQGPTR